MVQVASSSSSLEADDYLWPLSTIRVTLRRPDPESVPSPKLLPLLRYHLTRLQRPWQPFSPAASGKTPELSATLTIPRTSASIEVTEGTKVLAGKLAERAGISPSEAALLIKSYDVYALDQATGSDKLERLLAWYTEEVEAVPGIVLAIEHLCKVVDKQQSAWVEIATTLREEIIPDASTFMEGLFRGWGSLAQKQIEGAQRAEEPMLWSTHQLRHQSALLDLLFSTLYETPYRTAKVSEGLIRGSVLSGFGTSQANREIWETDAECQRLATRIRDMTLLLAIEAMCLNMVVSPGGEINTEGTLLSSRDGIFSLHLFLLEHSDAIQPLHPEPEKWEFPVTPMAVVCLAWAIFLGSLTPELSPPGLGYEGSVQGEMQDRAIRLPSGLFPWMEEVLSGPAFAGSDDDDDQEETGALAGDETFRRKVLKDVLIGLSEMLPLDRIQDRSGLYRCWVLLFGAKSRTSLTIAADYWLSDAFFDPRRSILDGSRYPLQPTYLPSVLSALSAVSSEAVLKAFDISPCAKTFAYLSEYPGFTHVIQPRWYRFIGRDPLGRTLVEAAKDIVFPGGERVFAGRRGAIISEDDDTVQLVTWQGGVSSWGLLIQILRSAVGLRGVDERDVQPSEEIISLSVGDLGLQGNTSDVLQSGMELLASVIRPATNLLPDLLDCIGPGQANSSPILVILELALAVLSSSAQSGSELSETDCAACVASLDVLRHLAREPEVWLALRASSFFGLAGRKKGIATALIRSDAARTEHDLTVAMIKLMASLLSASKDTAHADEVVIRACISVAFADIWNQLAGWTYSTPIGRCEIIRDCATLFAIVARAPFETNGTNLSVAARSVVEVFISGAANPHYRPIIDSITDSSALYRHCLALQRRSQAGKIVQAVQASIALLADLLRLSEVVDAANASLPNSVFGLKVGTDEQLYFVESLIALSFDPLTSDATVIAVLRLLRTYVEVTGKGGQKPSLASMLRDPEELCLKLASLANADQGAEQQAAAWDLLASMIANQAGVAPFCIAGIKTDEDLSGGAIRVAMDHIITGWEDALIESPHVVSAVLGYFQAVFTSPGSGKAVPLLRKDAPFWQAVHDIATRPVPTPPTFTLSMHSEDFTARIQSYAYATQAKANATALLALELDLVLEAEWEEEEDARTAKALELVLSLWRNGATLEKISTSAVHSSANVELHETEGRRLKAAGVELGRWRTSKIPAERQFGRTYLYDGNPRVDRELDQPAVNLAIDMLNLNWSMLEADMALTKAFRALGDAVSAWAEGDALIAKAAARAVLPVSAALSDEDRGGDVMLAIQAERLSMLQSLMEAALGDASLAGHMDAKDMSALAVSVRSIADNSTFPPVASLRHADLHALHRPILRILFLFFRAASSVTVRTLHIDSALESGAIVILEAADVVLDSLIHGAGSPSDLGLVVDPLCEIITIPASAWLNRIVESNLMVRSLDLLVRAKLRNGAVPTYLPSILLLHLALASQPASAEKLAVSGLIPAYSGNLISTEAEYGRLESAPAIGAHSAHAAWCSMLTVIKALLTSLPNTAGFVRSDIMPFIRVSNAQLLRALSWDADAALTLPSMNETELVLDLLFEASQALANTDAIALLLDFVPSSIGLLKSIRHAFTHPRRFSSLVVPSTEDEQTGLEAELGVVESQQDVSLVDYDKTSILASRVYTLLRMSRTIACALINITQSWGILQDGVEVTEDLVLESDSVVTSTSSDPVGVLIDINNLVSSLSQKISISTPESAAALRVAGQVAESTAILTAAQLIARHSLMPDERDSSMDSSRSHGGMDIDEVKRETGAHHSGHKRLSLGGLTGSDRERAVWRELEADLLGVLSGDGGLGDRRLFTWLESVLGKRVGDE